MISCKGNVTSGCGYFIRVCVYILYIQKDRLDWNWFKLIVCLREKKREREGEWWWERESYRQIIIIGNVNRYKQTDKHIQSKRVTKPSLLSDTDGKAGDKQRLKRKDKQSQMTTKLTQNPRGPPGHLAIALRKKEEATRREQGRGGRLVSSNEMAIWDDNRHLMYLNIWFA